MTSRNQWIALDALSRRIWWQSGSETRAQAHLAADQPLDQTLNTALAGWPGAAGLPIIASGLAEGTHPGAWPAVPALPLCAAPLRLTLGPHEALALPGLRQAHPPALMNGPQTAIAGFLALNTQWDGVICLPGATSFWCQVSAGEVVSIQPFLSGQLRKLLGSPEADPATGASTEFAQALSASLSRPESLAARLASSAAAAEISGTDPAAADAQLCGALIGAELAAARPYWLGQNLVVMTGDPLAPLYVAALSDQGVPVSQADAAAMTLAGLAAARRLWSA